MDVAGRRILVVGLARTGVAVCRFLLGRGSEVVIADDKTKEDLTCQIETVMAAAGNDRSRVRLCLGGTFAQRCERLDLAVLSPGVPPSHPTVRAAVTAGIPIISEIELAARFLKGRIIGITGSNGKTTCTAMTGAILAQRYRCVRVSGNIGDPLIDQVGREDEGCWHVVELSSFQLEGVDRFRPRVSVMLNLTPDHMDRHGSLERYGAAKERIFRNQGADDAAVLNADDAAVAAMAPRIRARVLWFSSRGPVAEGAFVAKGRIVFRKDGSEAEVMPLSDIPLRGRHNVENVLACTAAAMTAGVAPDEIAAAVRNFRAVEHRLEYVDTIGGVAFFNDSKATNVDAALKALQSFREPLVVILGGRDKGSDFSPLRQEIAERARHVIVLGEAAGKIEQALAPAVSVLWATSLEEAVQKGFSRAAPGDVVLLAPACASFDMFRDYQDRGENFKAAVRRLRKAGE